MWQFLKNKKFWVIVLLGLTVGLGVWFLYWLWQPAAVPVTNQPVGQTGFPTAGSGGGNVVAPGNNNLPQAGTSGGFTQPTSNNQSVVQSLPIVTTDAAVSPDTASSRLRYYNPVDCKFYEIDASGARHPLIQNSEQSTYCGVQKVTWSPGDSKAIMEFPDRSKIIYDFKNQKQYTLPKEMESFSFSPDGSQVAGKYMADNVNDRWIIKVNSDGSGLTGIQPMGENANKVEVAWSANNQVIAFSATGDPQGAFTQQILPIGFNQENFKALYVNGRGFESTWTPDGQKLLYSVYNDTTDYKPTLFLVDATVDKMGQNNKSLNLQTWSDRCTMSGAVAYCAVPENLPQGAGLVRELAQGLSDTIWRVDLRTGVTSLLAKPTDEQGNGLSINQITVSPDNKTLYFTDTISRQVRSLQLAQ